MFYLSIWKSLKHGWIHKPTLQIGQHVLGFLEQTQHLYCVSIFPNNVDPKFSHLLQLLHCLTMNSLWDRWCLWNLPIWPLLDISLEYDVWSPINSFLHPEWIVSLFNTLIVIMSCGQYNFFPQTLIL